MSKPVAIIYRNYLLSSSETFVRSQAGRLQKFTPYFVGARLIKGLDLPSPQTLIVNKSGGGIAKAREVSFKLSGFLPGFVHKIKQLKPVLIHAHFGQDGAIALPLARNLQVPLLVTFHGADITIRDDKAERSLSQMIYRKRRNILKQEAQLFIAVSDFIKQKLLFQGFPEDKIVVHYIGIDTKEFQTDLSKPREQIVLFVARLVEKKGCEYLIRAMAKVQAMMPDIELVVIGDGPLRSSLETLAKKLLVRYRFLGVQPSEYVKDWMQRATLFCVPSITANSGDSEGFGLVFTEAQAMGLPVVSFASGGIPEAVAHEQTGLLAPEGNVEHLSVYILQLLQDQELWQRFSHKGQERVHTFFNLKKQTLILEDIYANAAKPKVHKN
jgi:glycosyltransferase involved in cell wall biosynthesis